VASVPFARRLNRPAINVLGEPVNKFISDRFLSKGRGDVLWETLAAKQAWVSVPDRGCGDRQQEGWAGFLSDVERGGVLFVHAGERACDPAGIDESAG
jgi:hypothetical protein